MTVGIIIPTKNRSEFLIRQLQYYADVGCTHSIFVGDVSEGENLDSTVNAIAKLKEQIAVNHIQLPKLTESEVIKEISQQVETTYVALASDDDFLIPSVLEDCGNFLDSHPGYNSAYGLIVSFAVGFDRACGEFVRTTNCTQQPADEPSGRLRSLDFLASYWPARVCVQRTGDFRDVAEKASIPPDKDFRELLASCLPIIRGKSQQLDRLYLMRQDHIQSSPPLDGFDWVTDPNWWESYSIFRCCMEEELVLQDSIGIDESAEVIKEGFWSYMSRRLAKAPKPRSRLVEPSLGHGWKRAARQVPGIQKIRRLGREFRTINPPGSDKFSLSMLMNPSSPYHADFLPVFRAVTTPIT